MKTLQPKYPSDLSWLVFYLAVSFFAFLLPRVADFSPLVIVSVQLTALLFAVVVGSWNLYRWLTAAEN